METDETRTGTETDDDRECPETVGYVVDADAVAAAIVDRLLAGRAVVLRRSSGRRSD